MAKEKFNKVEFKKELGRIKYMQQSGMFGPPPITKRMMKRMAEFNINFDDIKPVKVDLKNITSDRPSKKRKNQNERQKRIYRYYLDGVYRMTGTKEAIAGKENISVHTISQLVSKKHPMRKGRGLKTGSVMHSCEPAPDSDQSRKWR